MVQNPSKSDTRLGSNVLLSLGKSCFTFLVSKLGFHAHDQSHDQNSEDKIPNKWKNLWLSLLQPQRFHCMCESQCK